MAPRPAPLISHFAFASLLEEAKDALTRRSRRAAAAAEPVADEPEWSTDPATRAEAEEDWFAQGKNGREVAAAFNIPLRQAAHWATEFRNRQKGIQ